MLSSYINLCSQYDTMVTTIHKANQLNWMGPHIITQIYVICLAKFMNTINESYLNTSQDSSQCWWGGGLKILVVTCYKQHIEFCHHQAEQYLNTKWCRTVNWYSLQVINIIYTFLLMKHHSHGWQDHMRAHDILQIKTNRSCLVFCKSDDEQFHQIIGHFRKERSSQMCILKSVTNISHKYLCMRWKK